MQDQTNLLLLLNLVLVLCGCLAFWLIRCDLRATTRDRQLSPPPATSVSNNSVPVNTMPRPQAMPMSASAPGLVSDLLDGAQRQVRADVWGDGSNDIVRVLAVGVEANGYRLTELQSTARQWLATIEPVATASNPLGSIAVSDRGDRRTIELVFAQSLPHPMTMLVSAAVGAGFRLVEPDDATPDEVVGFRGQSRLLAAGSIIAPGFTDVVNAHTQGRSGS